MSEKIAYLTEIASLDRDRLREIPRLVDVTAAKQGDVVREDLQGDGEEDRHHPGVDRRKLHNGRSEAVEARVTFGDEPDDLAVASCGFLQVAECALAMSIPGHERDDGKTLLDERDGAVLHLPGRVSLCVNVRDLLELESSFESDRVERPSAEIQRVRRLIMLLGEPL